MGLNYHSVSRGRTTEYQLHLNTSISRQYNGDTTKLR